MHLTDFSEYSCESLYFVRYKQQQVAEYVSDNSCESLYFVRYKQQFSGDGKTVVVVRAFIL